MIKRSLLILILSFSFVFAGIQGTASAQQTITCPDGREIPVTQGAAGVGTEELCNYSCRNSFLGLPVWYKYLQTGIEDGRCTVILPTDNGETDWARATGYIALAIVEALLMIAALVTVGYVMYGGFRYITSQGDPEGAKSARQTIINALTGLVIAMIASGVVRFIGAQLGQ